MVTSLTMNLKSDFGHVIELLIIGLQLFPTTNIYVLPTETLYPTQ